MDAAGTKYTRFGLLYKLLHQNEIVPFFMDEKRNVAYVYYCRLRGSFFYLKKRFLKKIKSGVHCAGFFYNFARRGAKVAKD